MENPSAEQTPEPPATETTPVLVPHEHMTFELIKRAIYERAKALYDQKRPISTLRLGKELYEILNKRLVFRTAAHREQPHFITPSGSLRVPSPEEGAVPPDGFIID